MYFFRGAKLLIIYDISKLFARFLKVFPKTSFISNIFCYLCGEKTKDIKIWQIKGEGIDDCIVRAVSVFSLLDDAKRLLRLPKFKQANIAEVQLESQDGKIKKTFNKSHYSWWRSKNFDVSKAKIVTV